MIKEITRPRQPSLQQIKKLMRQASYVQLDNRRLLIDGFSKQPRNGEFLLTLMDPVKNTCTRIPANMMTQGYTRNNVDLVLEDGRTMRFAQVCNLHIFPNGDS